MAKGYLLQSDLATSPLGSPQWIKVTKDFSDFAAAAVTNDISIVTLPAGAVLVGFVMNPTITFSGGLIATYTLSLGVAGNLTRYSPSAINVFTGATGGGSISIPASFIPNDFGGTTDVRAAAISTVGNLDAATQGSVDIYLLVSMLP